MKHQTPPIRTHTRTPYNAKAGHKKVLWFLPEGYTVNRQKYATRRYAKVKGNANDIRYTSVHTNVKGCWVLKPKSKKLKEIPQNRVNALINYITKAVQTLNPSVVVINDICMGRALFSDFFIKDKLETYRGSVLEHTQFPGVTFLVIDDALKCYQPFDSERVSEDTYAWIFVQDLKRLKRYVDGTTYDHRPMDYCRVRTTSEVREMASFMKEALAFAFDCETSGSAITCISLVGITQDGAQVRGWTIPFFAGYCHDGEYWDHMSDVLEIWQILREVFHDPIVPKIAQNGTYDINYLMKYAVFPQNFTIDTQLLMHSFCGTVPKGLGFLASLFNDNYRYWKDEIKGDGSTNDVDKTGTSVPLTEYGCDIYWEYCAKDSYNTLYAAVALLPLCAESDWIMDNYSLTLRLQHGPMLQASLQGFRIDAQRHALMIDDLTAQAVKAHQRLLQAVHDPKLNPKSAQQLSKLFFDVLGVKPFKGTKRTTQEKPLRRMCFRHALGGVVLRYLTDYKRPLKLLEDLNAKKWRGRFMYSFNAAGTWTGRASSSKHHFWIGKNVQNISKKLRPALLADKGYWLVPIDFSQSDGYFVAFESQDERYIEKMYLNMNEGYDTHSYHVELLLKQPYDDVIEGKKTKDPKIVDPVTGSRQIIKRVVHGKNYDMKENTMLTTVGVASIIAAAKYVGWHDAHMWTDEKLKRFTKSLGFKYDDNYPTMTKWKDLLLTEVYDGGNTLKAYGGRTHLIMGNPLRDTSGRIKRQAAAFKGQGGTAGNINRTLLEVYYEKQYVPADWESAYAAARGEPYEPNFGYLYEEGVTLYGQIHDEIVFGVPIGKEYLIDKLLAIMEKRITIHGREFFVPCEAEMGLSFGVLIDYEGSGEGKSSAYYLEKAKAKEDAYLLKLKNEGIKL